MFGIRRATKEFCVTLREISDEHSRLKAENERLRELALKNWYIALSEREALRAHDIYSDGGTYMAALDDAIAAVKDRMRKLGIEVNA